MMDLSRIYSKTLEKFVMTSREIVIDLIDKGLITGEQAFTLINDIVAAEIKEAIEVLNESKKNWGSIRPGSQGTASPDPWISPWTYQPTTTSSTITSNLDSSTYTISNIGNANANGCGIVDAGYSNANTFTLSTDDTTYTIGINSDSEIDYIGV